MKFLILGFAILVLSIFGLIKSAKVKSPYSSSVVRIFSEVIAFSVIWIFYFWTDPVKPYVFLDEGYITLLAFCWLAYKVLSGGSQKSKIAST